MAELEYSKLETDYFNFSYPRGDVTVAGKSIAKTNYILQQLEVELSSGYEASMATFSLGGVYNQLDRKFETSEFQKFVALGSQVEISFGYDAEVETIFVGFIAKVNFRLDTEGMPGVDVTCFDVKGLMMTGRSSRQLAAKYYGEAVQERVQDARYTNFITEAHISNTPDMPPAPAPPTPAPESDLTMEMVNESDYEYVTKIAKRFNFEFYCVGGHLVFRKAKQDTSTLMIITSETGLKSLNVEYDISGLSGSFEVRSTNPDTGKLIKAKTKNENDLSLESKAKSVVSKAKMVYIDPTVSSDADATARAEYLLEENSFRLGTAYLQLVGIPKLVPGRYIEIVGFGDAVDNLYYIVTARHIFDDDKGYVTELTAKTAGMKYKPKSSLPI